MNTTDSNYGSCAANAVPNTTAWYHVVGVYEHNQPLRIYVNGVNDTKYSSGTPTGNILDTDSTYWIGRSSKAILDEVRISNTARDACWIETNYNNQNGPGSFTTVGSEIMLGKFENRKQITLHVSQRGSSCTGSLSNFPVLINLSGDWLKTKANGGTIYNSNGYDIIFRDANNNHLIGGARAESLVVRNQGTDLLSVSVVSVSPGEYTVGGGGFDLAPGASRTLMVTFVPQIATTIPGTLTIESNDPDEGEVVVPLSGTGLVPPDVAATPGLADRRPVHRGTGRSDPDHSQHGGE